MYTQAREEAGMTQKQAAERLHIGIRTLRGYEARDVIPNPEIVLDMSWIYQKSELTMRYCRYECAIGRAYSYEVLDAVNTDLAHVFLKLAEEMDEAKEMLAKAMRLVINKRTRYDFNDKDWQELKQVVLEFLDVEHSVEVLKLALGSIVDVAEFVNEHNKKCCERGYVKEKKTASSGQIKKVLLK